MDRRLLPTIIAPILLVPLFGSNVGAQVDTYRAVQRYNKVAKGSNVTEWHRRVFDDDVDVRLDAVESLGKEGGEQSVKPLLDATADPDVRVRAKAFDYLGMIGSRRATSLLTQYLFLSDIDRSSKQRILVALGRIGDPNSVGSLADFIAKTEDDELRCAALYALGEVGSQNSLDVVQPYAESEHPHERRIARDAVVKINDRLAAAPNEQPTILELEKQLESRRR